MLDSVSYSSCTLYKVLSGSPHFILDNSRRGSIGQAHDGIQANFALVDTDEGRIANLHPQCRGTWLDGQSIVRTARDRPTFRIGFHEHLALVDGHKVLDGRQPNMTQLVFANEQSILS